MSAVQVNFLNCIQHTFNKFFWEKPVLALSLKIKGSTIPIEFRSGLSTTIVGANGSGKTTLAIECEHQLGGKAHRISAQRKLALDPNIEKVSENAARGKLRYGQANWGAVDPENIHGLISMRILGRWGNNGTDFILNDGGFLLQLLFAEQANVAVRVYNALQSGEQIVHEDTYISRLKDVFHAVVPNRRLNISADDITVSPVIGKDVQKPYTIRAMSDGEKAVFYMIGQALVAPRDSVLITDEPEIHIHRAVLSKLWDELEALRPDCAFLLITHDLEFAASRAGNKYFIRQYTPISGWAIESIPEAENFSEDTITLILGSRKPILFVEGEKGSLDVAFYRACYPGWTVVPRGGCESVIHSVVTMQRNTAFTRVQCAGLIDADAHDDYDCQKLAKMGVRVLPVSEIENLLLLPEVSRAILEMNDFCYTELEYKLANLKASIFADALNAKNVNDVVLRYCRRRIDRLLKQIDLSSNSSVEELASDYQRRTNAVDIKAMATELNDKIGSAVAADDLNSLLAIYDRKKPLLALAASHLRNWNVETFAAWVVRAIQSRNDDRLRKAIRAVLPEITAIAQTD